MELQSSLAQRFAHWGAPLTVSHIPSEVRVRARRAILDVIGAVTCGSVHPTVTRVRSAMGGERGSCTVMGGSPSSAAVAALINGTAAHVWDFDDTSYAGIMHGSAVVFPAVLAAAEENGIDDEALLTAFVVGSEVAYTLAEVTSHSHYFKGWWSTATFGLIGATAGAARAYALDREATTHAIAMAAAGAGATKCIFGTDSKPFFVGETARRAIDFCRVAAAGLTGPFGAFEDKRGFFSLLNDAESSPDIADTLGSKWRLHDPGLFFKLNPVCSAAHAPIEATSRLIRENSVHISDIAQIRCEVSELVKISLVFDRPKSPQQAQFSLPYAIACAVTHGQVSLEDLRQEEIMSPAKQRIMEKVEYIAVPELSAENSAPSCLESARVTVTLASGLTLQTLCREPYGMPGVPLSSNHLWEKFVACASHASIPPATIDKARLLASDDPQGHVPIRGIVRSLAVAACCDQDCEETDLRRER